MTLTEDPGFCRLGPALPETPVLLSVPHAGRAYPPALLEAAAVPEARLRMLEDRHADALVHEAVNCGATALVASMPRAWIDLNRDPRDMDAGMIEGPLPSGLNPSARSRAGLGLIPRRLGNGPELWRRKISAPALAERIAKTHRTWHEAVANALHAARTRHDLAILIDCHSMPPLRPDAAGGQVDMVIGDRFGRSAAPDLVDRIQDIARSEGLRVARNSPYAGGYALERHGDPAIGLHAIQIELDRRLYLDDALEQPGPGLAAMQALYARLFRALADFGATPLRAAAE